MSVLKAVEIHNVRGNRTIKLFPDKAHVYWDAYTTDKHNRQSVYYQMHLTTILDMIYRAGVQGHEVKLQYEGGNDVELQH